ncbi:glycogen/starch synthase [Winogradskyella maritima]|uniref:Glycogen synthase n=1 Tax=Winogradskyella maritima TaxID=1517766 RepID=A0ABV8AH53_9FLAO|nr:glycogen/starch synthase [Winogradskyella maritima]
MNILHISAECYPLAKVGGLADVVGALPKYQNGLGQEASVIMPFYNLKFFNENTFDVVYKARLKMGESNIDFSILKLTSLNLGFDMYCVDIRPLLYQDNVYSNDDTKRFLAFQIAVLDWIKSLTKKPEVIHCHDHHTGLVPFMVQQCYDYKILRNTPTVLTIHNAQYQGWFGYEHLNLLPEFNHDHIGLLDWDGTINPLAVAIKCAWRVTTVSQSYMEELQNEANGLEALLKHESAKCIGILNGIDTEVWDPMNDEYLEKNYKVTSVLSGKKGNKKYLCQQFNLDPSKPLISFIGRLVGEKGADILPQVFESILKQESCNILLLGSGFDETEKALLALKDEFKGNYNVYVGYNEQLSHIIYAGSDFLIMPSRVEPCGLNQMYALRYGTIPIVRSIGGLIDTVTDIDDNGFGIRHKEVSVKSSSRAIERGIDLHANTTKFNDIRKRIMKIDHSWDVSAKAYVYLYNSIINP